jgi:hypothetical protein
VANKSAKDDSPDADSAAAQAPDPEAAERAEEAAEQAAKAEERRAREAERAQEKKSYPDDADAPTQVQRSGEDAFAISRLITDAPDFLGVASHVAAGALHNSDKEYLTVEQAKKQIDAWLGTEV